MTMESKHDTGISYTEELTNKIEAQKGIIKFLYQILNEMPNSKVQEVLGQLAKENQEVMPWAETIKYIEEEVLEQNENSNQ
jgi:rubrerythrin